MTMNEHEFAGRIVARLDADLGHLPMPVAGKLRSLRQQALTRAGDVSVSGYSRAAVALRGWLFGGSLTLRLALPAAIVVASLTGLIYWQTSVHRDDDLETGLLAGELPIHAYLDPDFESWLQNASYTSRQQ
jgi:hypothetical protein